jgi:hypothetical protein
MATYLSGQKATCTINGKSMAVEEGSYETNSGVDEVTNLLSGGFYEDIPTIKRATCSIRCVYNGDDPPDFDEGDVVALAIDVPAVVGSAGPPVVEARPRGPGITGNFRVTRMAYPIVNPKAAVRYNFDASSNGAYVKTIELQPEL